MDALRITEEKTVTDQSHGQMPRQDYWDGVKAIAIIAVIVIHSSDMDGLGVASFEAKFGMILRHFAYFAVPMFFGLSGLLAGRSGREKNAQYAFDRLKYIIWPYLIWTIIFIVLFQRDHLTSPRDILIDLIAGRGIGIGYFVIVLAQMIVLTPIIDRIRTTRMHVLVMVMGSIAGIAFTYIVHGVHHPILSEFPYRALPFFVWYPFYHFGFFAARCATLDVKRARFLAGALIMAAALLLLSIIDGLSSHAENPSFAVSQTKASSLLYSFAAFIVVLFAYPYLKNRTFPKLAWVGQNSFVIYLAHLIPLRIGVRSADQFLMVGSPSYIATVVLITFVLCCIGAWIGRRILPGRLQRYVMG